MVDTSAVHPEDSSLFQVVRVSRDGASAIIKRSTGTFEALSLKSGENLHPNVTDFAELSSLGSWRKVTSDESEALVASIESSAMDIVAEFLTDVKPYRVPAAVQSEIRDALRASAVSGKDLEIAKELAYAESVSLREVEWIDSFFCAHDQPQRLRGGYKGQKWASRILNPQTDEDYFGSGPDTEESYNKYDFDDETFAYYAAGPNDVSGTTEAEELYAVDFSTGSLYIWGPDGFDLLEGADIETFEAPVLLLIDQYTAEEFARWLDENQEPESMFDVVDVYPEERNLFALAESELDYDELDNIATMIAAGVGKYGGVDLVPNDYTPEERSINAKRQVRGVGGKFGGPQIKPGVELLGYTKARLEEELPLVENPAGRIQEFIATAPVTAAGTLPANPNPAPAAEPAPAEVPQEEAVDKATAPDESNPILYFAIVDNADKTAVLNCVGITKTAEGTPQAFMRENATWVDSQSLLDQLMGATPPPVVELSVPEPAKGVLAQIDAYDAEKEQFPTDAIPNSEPAPVAASAFEDAIRGFALSDGELAIHDADDLVDAVAKFASFDEDRQAEAKAHIRKRAFALNRMDLVPEEMRTLSLGEKGELLAKKSPLFSEYGELLEVATSLTASGGHRGGSGNAENLMNYWAHGKGAAKIRWGTKGDLTRAHRHLSKYVGPKLAWGLAQNLHKRVFGVINIVHDRATGQYEGRGKRR